MQRDIAECVTDTETTFNSAEVDLSGEVKGSVMAYCEVKYMT